MVWIWWCLHTKIQNYNDVNMSQISGNSWCGFEVGLNKNFFRPTPKQKQSSSLLGLCEGRPHVTGEFPSERTSNGQKRFPYHDITMEYLFIHVELTCSQLTETLGAECRNTGFPSFQTSDGEETSIKINNNKHAYRQSQVRMPNGCGVKWAECSLIKGTDCRVQVVSLILDSSVGLSVGIQSAGDLVSETLMGSNPALSRGRQLVSFRFEYRLPVPEHRT